MASQAPPLLPLSESLDRYRSRIYQLNCNMLTKFLEQGKDYDPEKKPISRDSTDPEDLEYIEVEEWNENLPSSVRTPNDLYPLLSNGTSPPIPQEKREELFRCIEEALNAQIAPEFRPLSLPEDFKELCGLTDSLEGAGLPKSHCHQTPDAFNGLYMLLKPVPGEQLEDETFLDTSGWEVAGGMHTGDFENQGGMWLCWYRSKNEISSEPDATSWKWRWCGKNDVHTVMFENVRELVDKFWGRWRGINRVYGDLGYKNIL